MDVTVFFSNSLTAKKGSKNACYYGYFRNIACCYGKELLLRIVSSVVLVPGMYDDVCRVWRRRVVVSG